MKLLLCSELYFPSIGGVQEVTRQIATRLALLGHDVTVATSSHSQRAADVLLDGVRVVSFDAGGNLIKQLRGEFEAYRNFVIAGRFGAILVNAAQQWTFDALMDVIERLPARKVLIPCGFSGLHWPEYRDYYHRMKEWLGRFDALIFNSRTYQDILFAQEAGWSNLHVLKNGADEQEFATVDRDASRADLSIPENKLFLISVGSLFPEKGHWEAVMAYGRATIPQQSVLMINTNNPVRGFPGNARRVWNNLGNGRAPLPLLAAAIRMKSLGHKRVILRDLPRGDLVKTYKAADIFLFASHLESSGLVLFEALAAGLPFLSTDVGNAREIVEWTGCGRVIPKQDPTAADHCISPKYLAAELSRFAAENETRRRMSAAGRRAFFEQGFDWASIAKDYEAVLTGTALPDSTHTL